VILRRFYVTRESIQGDQLTFDAGETHHIARVLRLRPGDLVVAVDGQACEYTVRLDRVTPRRCTGTIVGDCERRVESPVAITLAQGIPKGDKMDAIIRAATELGVSCIAPLITRRTVVRLDAARGRARCARWQRVAQQAAKQCGRAVVPAVLSPRPLADFLSADPGLDLRLCLWERASTGLSSALDQRREPAARITLIIGPEGGLAPEEVELAVAAQALVVGLGPRILRTETAGASAVAILQHLYGDLGCHAGRASPPPSISC
jgi:16S rRNA (uracil1498-N3)-methyltransferase